MKTEFLCSFCFLSATDLKCRKNKKEIVAINFQGYCISLIKKKEIGLKDLSLN